MTSGRSRLACLLAPALALGGCTLRANDVTETQADAAATADARDAAGEAADAGPPCVPGGTSALEPVVVACGQPKPARVVLDETNVYWTTLSSGPVVMKAPIAGGPAVPLVFDTAGAAGLAVDAVYAYYTQPALARVMRVPIAGGPAVSLATRVISPLYLALADGALYWTGGLNNGGYVMRLDLTAGAMPVTLIDGQTRPRAIAVRDGFVYWTDIADGALLRVPAAPDPGAGDGGVRTATRLASGVTGPNDLVLAGAFAYVPDQLGSIARIPLEGGDPETFAEVRGVPFGVATDGVSLYWTTLGDGGVFRALLRGGPPVTVSAPELDPHFLAVGDVSVFWGTWGDNALKKFAK